MSYVKPYNGVFQVDFYLEAKDKFLEEPFLRLYNISLCGSVEKS